MTKINCDKRPKPHLVKLIQSVKMVTKSSLLIVILLISHCDCIHTPPPLPPPPGYGRHGHYQPQPTYQSTSAFITSPLCVGITSFLIGTGIGFGFGALVFNRYRYGGGVGIWFGKRRRRSIGDSDHIYDNDDD